MGTVRLEVAISGKQNLSWIVRGGDAVVILGLVESASELPPATESLPDIGYRGFKAHILGTEIVVFDGVIRITTDGQTTRRRDGGDLLELYMIKLAAVELSPELMRCIETSRAERKRQIQVLEPRGARAR